ncbi:MAG: outer membrane beta-barrel protein [Flavobacteriaceae bacterium]|nr:outer membrane beta-barrel protein [Flavobacteriaceae bacterium]
MKQKLTLLILLIGLNTIAQIKFEKGTFTTNDGKVVHCLIKNVQWKNNPVDFEYKLEKNSELQSKSITTVTSFQIGKNLIYKRFNVEIDISSSLTTKLKNNRKLNNKKETLFLKLLVSGKASLWEYQANNLRRFFYQKNNQSPVQLGYKKYLTASNLVGENNIYKIQLKQELPCKKLSTLKVNYKKSDLIRYIKRYNNCNNNNYVEDDSNSDSKSNFNFYAKLGLELASYTLRGNDFDSKIGPQLGVEVEYVLPYNKGKWSFFIEPTFHYYYVDNYNLVIPGSSSATPTTYPINFKYSSIRTPIGVKHNLYLNNQSRVFFSAAFTIDFNLKSEIDFNNRPDLQFSSPIGLAFGLGYNWNSKINMHLQIFNPTRFNTNGLFNDAWDDNRYKSFSINFGYRIF